MEVGICFASQKTSYLQYVDEIIDNMDLSEMETEIGAEEYLEQIQGESIKEKIKFLVSGGVDGQNVLNLFLSFFISGFKNTFPTLFVLFAVAVISGMSEMVKPNGKSGSMSGAVYFICYLSALSVIVALFAQEIELTKNCLKKLTVQTDIFMPLIIAVMAMGGLNSSVLLYRPITVILSQLLYRLCTVVMLPLAVGVTILNALNELSDGVNFSALKNFLTSSFKWVFGLAVTAFGVFVSVKGISSQAFDSLSVKSIKYASSSLPVVGGFVSGSTELFVACCAIVKNSLGKLFLIVVIFQIASPFLNVLIVVFCLNLISSFAQPFADKKIISLYTGIAKSLTLLLSVMAMVFLMYFITLVMLLLSSGNV